MNNQKILNIIGDIERCIYFLVENPNVSIYDCPWTQSEEFRNTIDLSKYHNKNLTYITEDLLMQSHYLTNKFYGI